jgi:hypothetical protein
MPSRLTGPKFLEKTSLPSGRSLCRAEILLAFYLVDGSVIMACATELYDLKVSDVRLSASICQRAVPLQ